MREAVNCLKCYRIYKYDNIIFCPFIGLKECIRGRHYVEVENSSKQEVKKNIVKLETKVCDTPDFKPADKCASKKAVQWEQYHEKIFEMLKAGYTKYRIAKEIGVNICTLYSYVSRYDHK